MATRVFLLSADEKAVHVITQILDEQDIRFEHSSDPTFTLKRLAGQHFDILVVDCDNAESAMQVFNSARASQLNKGAIAVAIVEGKAGVPNAFRLGASLVLTKPVSLEQARNTLRTAVGMTRKDTAEARATVVPPVSSMPALTPHPPVTAPVPVPTVAAPSANTSVPVSSPAPVSTGISVSPVTVPPLIPVVPIAPPASAQMAHAPQSSTPKSTDGPTLVKPTESAPPKASIPSPHATPSVVETIAIEKAVSAPSAPKPQPLQISETHVVKPENDVMSLEIDKAVTPKLESKPVSLSSAMLDAAESAVAMEELETALKASSSDSKPADNTEMFAPERKPANESSSDSDAPSSEANDSAATLRAGAVPAFGGLGQQPFAGIEPSNNSKRGLIIGGIVAGLAAAGFAGAWLYAPRFKSTMTLEYAHIREQLHFLNPKAAVAPVAAKPVPVVTPPVASTAPDQASTPATPTDLGTDAAAPASVAPLQPLPNAPSPARTSAVAPSPTLTAPPQVKSQPTPAAAPAPTTSGNAALINTSASTLPAATTKPADLFEVPEDYADDQVIHRIHPVYPKGARARKLQGSVVLQAIIDKQGKVDSLQLVSGDPLLAQAAADAVKQWRYKPYSHNGDPVEFQTRVTVDFKLPGLPN